MLKSIIHTVFTKAFVGLINLAVIILTSQFLGPDGRGTASLILTSVASILVVCNIIGGPVLVYMVPRTSVSDLLLPSALWALLLSLAGTFFLSIFNLIDAEYIPHIFILSLLKSLATNNQMVLLGKERVKASNAMEIIQSALIIATVLFFFFVLNRMEVKAYLAGLYVAYGVILVFSSIKVSTYVNFPELGKSIETAKRLFGYGIVLQLAAVLTFMTYRLSYYMIETISGRSAVGIFSNGVAIGESVLLVGSSIALNLVTRVANTGDQRMSQQLTLRMSRLSFLITVILIIPLLFIPSVILTKILGAGFDTVHETILLLSPGIAALSLNTILSHYYSGIGKYKVSTIAASAAFAVMITCNMILIPRMGIQGAALSSSLAYVSMLLYQMYCFRLDSDCRVTEFFFSTEDTHKILSFVKSRF